MVRLPFLKRIRSSGRKTTPNRRPIASIAPHLFSKLAERAKETFGGTSVPETLLTRRDATTPQFKPKKMQKDKGLVLKIASSTASAADETPGLVLKTVSSTYKLAPDETPVHGKVDLVPKLKGNAAKEFVSRDSELTYTRAISADHYVQRQLELGSIMQLVVITLTMVICCIRAAKCCRTLMMRVSIDKQTYEKAIRDHDDNSQKKAPAVSACRCFSSEKELKVSVAVHKESGETDRKQEDASTHGLIGLSVWTSIDSGEGTKEDDKHPVLMGCVNNFPCVSSQVTKGDKQDECFDQQAASLVSKCVKVNPGSQASPDRKQEEEVASDTLVISRQVTAYKDTKEGSDAAPVSLVTISAVEVSLPSLPSLWRDSSLEQEQEENAAIGTLSASSQINRDDDEEEETREDFESESFHLVIRGAHEGTPPESSTERQKQEQPAFVMTDWPPSRVSNIKGPVEVSDPKLIFALSKTVIEATHKSHRRDCPSLGSTTSSDSSISADGEMTNYRGGSSISSGGGTSMSAGSPGRSIKRISFCPSPPQVREYERYDMDPSSETSDVPVPFSNWNKKCRMLKKNLDKLNGEGDVPDQGKLTATRIAKKLGQALLVVSASVLTQRR